MQHAAARCGGHEAQMLRLQMRLTLRGESLRPCDAPAQPLRLIADPCPLRAFAPSKTAA